MIENDNLDPSQVDRANEILTGLDEDGFDTSWVYDGDAEYAMNYSRDMRKYNYDNEGVLAVPDDAHKAIWEGEILGQISDGAWENYWWESREGTDAWKEYFKLDIVVDEDISKPEIRQGSVPVKLDYHDELMIEGMIGRMMFYGRAVDDEFDEDDLNRVILGFESMA